ncbi:hypothetical protein GCM10010965_16130 [Caldalkalibacillus thermarum]|uniref:ABC transporter substrate-binding protein n=1 Tax=Caldalkalibacillus thermarum TaxID=296745 RepID=UPI00166DDBF8|nr:ABC transporter substrate-binding protein [Caldalkalibacillus thermarum]GGK24139.1 hypothetical protein GCM10010965_16130 [Caldalkalibacillus thermarum]
MTKKMKRSVFKQFKQWMTLGMIVLAAVLLLAACGGQETTGSDSGGSDGGSGEVVRIGGIFDITGATGDVGEPYAQGAKAYFEYVNEQGGLDGKEVKLYDIDYAYEVPQAIGGCPDVA